MSVIKKIRAVGIVRSLKLLKDRAVRPLVPKYYKMQWKRISKKKGYSGITHEKRAEELIVSLTTYPGRIDQVYLVIQTLLMQTVKPDKIILWLADEQFPEKKIPESLKKLEKYGLEIGWYKDIRSYKKLIPSLINYPDAVIVTADDDMFYHRKMVERLYKAYKKEPNYIHCHRVTKFVLKNGQFDVVPGGYEIYKKPTFLHKLTGGSGACYPPHALCADVTREDLFMQLVPTNDDIWFWLMGVKNGMRCNVVPHSCTAIYYVPGSQKQSLSSVNDNGEKLFWKQLNNVLEYYPELKEVLMDEWEKIQ